MTAVADRPVQTLLSIQLRWIAVLVVGSALYAAVLFALLSTGDVLYVPSLLLLGAAIVPVTFILGSVSLVLLMAATWWLHRDHPERAARRVNVLG